MNTQTARQAKEEFPLAKFQEWLAKQPEDRGFDYMDDCGCLFASFARESLGLPNASAGGDNIDSSQTARDNVYIIPERLADSACGLSNRFTIAQFRKQLEAE